jgi:hypothetical protein
MSNGTTLGNFSLNIPSTGSLGILYLTNSQEVLALV